jgi:tetratricopeptide (TPR) repeat protein
MQRLELARFLSLRGRYDWAEAELKRAEAMHAEEGHLSDDAELDVRDELALFYWAADEPERAAEALRPILVRTGLLHVQNPDKLPGGPDPGGPGPGSPDPASPAPGGKPPASERPGQGIDKDLLRVMSEKTSARRGPSFREYIPGSYHFYLGLAATKAGDLPRARAELRAAVALVGQNPDVLIAMTKVGADDAEFQAETDRAINRLEQFFRSELVSEEAELISATTRQSRLEGEMNIATDSNQLAWLLAGCQRKPREAIALSERSLTLSEDNPIYLDTLARCHFAAGNVDKAIQLQTRALKLMPHERQMQRQLAEFQAAKDAGASGQDTGQQDADAPATKESSDKR